MFWLYDFSFDNDKKIAYEVLFKIVKEIGGKELENCFD